MSLWRYLRPLYSLDTLDTRLVTSSRTPPHEQTGKQRNVDQDVVARARPSKWSTPEYFIHILIVSIAVPLMCWVPYNVSRASDPEYHKFEHLLSDGWIPGRKVDNSDQQYATFRSNIPYMAVVVVVHPLLRIVFNKVYRALRAPPAAGNSESAQAEARLEMRTAYDLIFAAIFSFVLHGFSALKVLLILFINYSIAKKLPRKWIPPATWMFNMATLFANELCGGYPYEKVTRAILPAPFAATGGAWGAWLDSYGGLISRWEILFNITVLRLISFNLDYYWALDEQGSSPIEKKQLSPSNLSERDRVRTPYPIDQYSLKHYISYTLYSPLYLAGPIVSFNDFLTQLRFRPVSITFTRTLLYAVRFLLALVCMEVLLHYMYVVAISKCDPNWSYYTPFQLSMLGFFNLHIIWLKLLLPWRFFRLWALLDGVDPPENMIRCMSNNYSALAFWRGWHRSLNRWIVRYVYVPLGGSGRQTSTTRSVFNMLIVFMFVALWHDINARLLAWSWLIVLFILPEMLCTMVFFPAKKYKDRPETYRVLCALGAVGNILMMMAANLVGFALGLDGLQHMVTGIVNTWQGLAFLLVAAAVLFEGVMVMFELREDEKRRGIDLNC